MATVLETATTVLEAPTTAHPPETEEALVRLRQLIDALAAG